MSVPEASPANRRARATRRATIYSTPGARRWRRRGQPRAGARIVGETIDGYDPKTLSDGRFVAHSGSEFETVPAVTADK